MKNTKNNTKVRSLKQTSLFDISVERDPDSYNKIATTNNYFKKLIKNIEKDDSVINASVSENKLNWLLEDCRNRYGIKSQRKDESGVADYMLSDIYKMYYKDEYSMSLNEDSSNYWWYKLLSRFDNSQFKDLTNYNDETTEIFVKHIGQTLVKILNKENIDKLKEEANNELNPNKSSQAGNNQQNSSQPNQTDSNSNNQNSSNQQSQNPQNTIESLNKTIDKQVRETFNKVKKELQEKAEEDILNQNAGNSSNEGTEDPISEETMNSILSKVKFNQKSINQFVTSTIKKFSNYFGHQVKLESESILDAIDIYDLDGLEGLLFPELLLDNISNLEILKSLKVDLYVDVSGSMSEHRNISANYNSYTRIGNSEKISMETLAKVLTIHMYKNKLINDFYIFQSAVFRESKETYLNKHYGGGTNINSVIKSIKQTNNPSLVITDASDSIDIYHKKAFIINIDYSSRMYGEAIDRYIANNQMLFFVDNRFLTPSQLQLYKSGNLV